jgi:hypothetical protein
MFSDRLQATGSIRAHAGKNDTDGAFAPVIGKAAKKGINRQTQPPRSYRIEQVERVVEGREILVGGNDINTVRLDLHPVSRLSDFHRGSPLQEFRQHAVPVGIKVLNDDESHAAIDRHASQKLFQCFQSASGRSYADDRKTLIFVDCAGRRLGALTLAFGQHCWMC